ncbi:MAG: hypothetical protein M3069_04765 [Chloroflexota bacterium]|nr:hypothetical protein [Chloroflexota bacterium]
MSTPTLPDHRGVTALDQWTLQVVMQEPTPFFPMLTSLWAFFPLPRAVIERVGDDKWMEPENIQSLAGYEAGELDLAAVPPPEADRVLADSRSAPK